MNYTTENITPEKASRYLQTSLGNRPISKTTVKSYADTMRRGKWLLNGMCIIFDNDGHLIDGHHRLLAVIESAIPVRFDVCRGASSDAFLTYDNGRHRNLGQLLAIHNVKNYSNVAAIVSANEYLVRNGRLVAKTRDLTVKGIKLTNADLYESFMTDPDGFSAAAAVINRLRLRYGNMLPTSWAGGLYYYLTHAGCYREDFVLRFFESLYTFDSSDIRVVDILRKRILKARQTGMSISYETLWAFVAKTWNSYAKGTDLKQLAYRPNQENLPKLILNNELTLEKGGEV